MFVVIDFIFPVRPCSVQLFKFVDHKLLQLLHTFDYIQHVKEATHKDNHILDLIISRSDDHIVCRPSVLDLALSDHYAVRCKFLLAKPAFKRKEIAYRNLKRINFDRFREDIITQL